MSKPPTYFIVNSRLTYVSTQLLMEWCGFKPKATLYAYYQTLESGMDFFLMDQVAKGDNVILIGFTKAKNAEMAKIFKEYNVTGIASDISETASVFEFALKKFANRVKLTVPQMIYCKHMLSAIKNNFKDKEPYFMNIVFNGLTPEKYVEHFEDGWNDINSYGTIIKKHIDLFMKESQDVFELDGLYFMNGQMKFLTDYVFKHGRHYDNLNVIDIDKMRVYFKKMYGSTKNVRSFCEQYCDNVLGQDGFCSGAITKNFLAVSKGMTNVKEFV
jgi:hypothetical protein